MKLIYRIAIFLILNAIAGPAMAAQICYSPAELQAEQLLRLHSELMVITVTCRQSSSGDNLVPAYTGFTKRNISSLHEAEQTLIRYFKVHFGGSGIDRLDQLRTRLGNEFGLQIAHVSAPVFCADRRDKVMSYYQANADEIQDEVQRMMVSEKSYGHACPNLGDTTRIARKGQ